MFKFIRKIRNRPVPKRLGWLDYTLFAIIIFLFVYLLISNYLNGADAGENPWSSEHDRKSFWSYFQYFRISWIEVILFTSLGAYLIYLRYKAKKKKEDEEK